MPGSLVTFVEEVSGDSHLRVEQDFGGGYVRLRTSEAQRRQAIQDIRSSEDIVLELLRNSRDAHASRIFVAMGKEGTKRHLTVIDDGCGIPTEMHSLIFEPRVTSKLDTSHIDAWGMHGRGMALYSIAQNALSATVMCSDIDLGTSIRVISDTEKLAEKADQSSFPTFELAEDNHVNVRGPKNIMRTVCEFAIDSRAHCEVYLGSASEICASLLMLGQTTLSAVDRLFCHDMEQLPLVKRLATCQTTLQFAESAARLGLDISERTARRVMDGEIEEAQPVLSRITLNAPATSQRSTKGTARATRSLKLDPDDASALAATVKDGFERIAERYYLEGDVEPTIRTRPDRITITIPIVRP